MSFEDYRKEKSSSWFSRVKSSGKSKKTKTNTEVAINIGLLVWNDKLGEVKPLRGKRLVLRTSSTSSYETIRSKAFQKFKDFYNDIIKDDTSYVLTFENGVEAIYIPGTADDFNLQTYKEELGKEYKNITLYLISPSDLTVLKKLQSDPFEKDNDSVVGNIDDGDDCDDLLFNIPPKKKIKAGEEDQVKLIFAKNQQSERKVEIPVEEDQVKLDELYAKNLQAELEQEQEQLGTEFQSIPAPTSFSSASEMLSQLRKNIVQDNGHFFIVTRRGATLERRLALWKREGLKADVQKPLKVQYLGEDGIDDGAIHKEFLTDIIADIKESVFPLGAPRDSMFDVQNGNFHACGQIAAVSLLQWGPPPLFFHENIFHMALEQDLDLKCLSPEKNFLPAECAHFQDIKEDPMKYSDFIIENGYTGVISKDNIESILGTVMIGITSRRRIYLAEFFRGLELFQLKHHLMKQKELFHKLFIKKFFEVVDATYVSSLLMPSFSADGSSRRSVENDVIDHFQDFLIMLEDEKITGFHEALVYNEEDEDSVKEHCAELTPGGVLKWMTGLSHKPVIEDSNKVTVEFNHNCMVVNPHHTICFPIVHACSKQIVLPVEHMKTFEGFKNTFILAYCNAQAFGVH